MNRRVGSFLVALGLIAADLVRPSLPAGIPVFQFTLTALAIAWVWRFWLADLREGGERFVLLFLTAAAAWLYLRHPRRLDADGINYFVYLRSLLVDRDLNLANDYVLLGEAGHAANVLPIGAPLVWGLLLAPLYVLRSLGAMLLGSPLTALEPAFVAGACLVSILLGLAGLFLLYREFRPHMAPLAAGFAVLLVWFGSPLRFYMRTLPSFAHAPEFFAAVLTLGLSRRLAETGGPKPAFLAGLACGLVYLIRSQDGLLLLTPAVFMLNAWLGHRSVARLMREGLSTLLGFLSLAWIQSAVWWSMFGAPFLVPHKVLHGEDFARPAAPKLLEMLFSDRGGLFATYPVVLVMILALPFAWRRARPWVLSAIIVGILQWQVNASIFDWYQVRRFTGTVPLFAAGLIAVAPALSRAGLVACASLVLMVHQYDLAIDSLRPLPGTPVPVRAALREASDSLAAPLYMGLERVSPATAVALFEGYTGSSLLTDGRTELDLVREDWWTRLPEPARRFSEIETEDGSLCRFIDGSEARLFLPLRGHGDLRLSFEVRAIETETPQRMTVEVNGQSLGDQTIAPSWQTARFILKSDAWHQGTNVVVLRFSETRHFFRLRGYGARAFRAAALRKITFHGPS